LAAAASADIDDELGGLPLGYGTRLSREYEDGAELSVGQWQRVAMSRAFFRDADLLILDEPTAALDPRAERTLYDGLRRLADGRTMLFISHRFSSARQADRILVLKDGSVIEDGTHEELVHHRGTYAELFELQASAYGITEV
jgi:ATP-binding cassette subfamily B protein